ncbi:hypothetical protein [Cellulomonas citrea]|uniref:hypothetical protein n=1 Tax=Cellulomonas citrea TaxID=1909423 RepID=UPI001357535C|nr:hypothetical protein [Cellulomonas citrea]
MFSPRDPDKVLGEVGSKVIEAIARATDGARADWQDLRQFKPSWIPPMSQRGVSNILHERIWAHCVDLLSGLDDEGITLIDKEPVREIVLQLPAGRTYRLRVKRHSTSMAISSYPTPADVEFWSGSRQDSFDGLEEIHLAAGYRWDSELRSMAETVISFREGKHSPQWMVEIAAAEPGSSVGPIVWSPITPRLPDIDLRRASGIDEERESQ